MKTLKLAALFAGFAISGAAGAANLVTNGSFESGLSGWTLSGVAADGFPAVVINYGAAMPYPIGAFGEAVPADSGGASPDAAGGHAAYFVGDLSNESLTQSVFLNPGVYTIGFSAYAPANGYANGNDALFSGSVAGVTLVNHFVSTGPVTTWQHFAGLVNILVAGNYNTTFSFNTHGAPAKDVVVDRVYIVAGNAVPEPATWAMMIAGFGLAGGVLRRRRSVAAI